MLAMCTVATLLDQITQEIAASNARAALLDELREAEQAVASNQARCQALEARGLMPWDEGWELRSQAHAALTRAHPRLRQRAQDARLALDHPKARRIDDRVQDTSILRERAVAQQRNRIYLSGD